MTFKSLGSVVRAQDTTDTKLGYKSSISFELGGVALYVSLNYEHLISYKLKEKILLRAGLISIPYRSHSGNIVNGLSLLPIGFYYLKGDVNHLELGLNASFGYYFTESEFIFSPSIGYRRQRFLSQKFSFSLAFSPLFLTRNNTISSTPVIPWFKINIGYNFNKKRIRIHSQQNDTIALNKRFFIDAGVHIQIAKQSNIAIYSNNGRGDWTGYNSINCPIDTSDFYKNSLILNKRIFPSLSFGFRFKQHEFRSEFSINHGKSLFSYSEDFGKYSYFNNTEYYFLLGYNYIGSLNKENKRNPKNCFYFGGNILFQHKNRQFYYRHFNAIGGGPASSEEFNSTFNSVHFSLIPDAGLKFGCQRQIYFKLGVRFNGISFVDGNFTWNYQFITDFIPQTSGYEEKSGRFSKLVFTGESGYFPLVDNFYLKVGFSF